MTGKQAVLEVLRAEGVRWVFGNPGTSEAPLLELLGDYPQLRYALATQEGVAVGMADGYARASGQPAFVCLHSDVGLANGISLLINAYRGGTPLVMFAVNSDTRKQITGRTDLPAMVGQFTKWSTEVLRAESIGGAMRRAFLEARRPPKGPVFVSLPFDVLDETTEWRELASTRVYARAGADCHAVNEAACVLLSARDPVLLLGDRVAQAGAVREAVRVAEVLGARVYAAHYSEVNFPTAHPQFLGPLGMVTPAIKAMLSDAGAVLAVGTSVFGGFFYLPGASLSPETKIVHVDCRAEDVGTCEPTAIGLVGNIRASLAALAESLEERITVDARASAARRRECAAHRKRGRAHSTALTQDRAMTADRIMSIIAGALPPGTITVEDAGTSASALHRAMEFDGDRPLYGVRGGAIGWGMGAALGVKLAHENRPVLAVVADGSAMMAIQALWTGASLKIPAVFVICNNGCYQVLKQNLDLYRDTAPNRDGHANTYPAMDFSPPFDIAGIASAMGVRSWRVEDPETLETNLRDAFACGRPALLDVIMAAGG
ncbi:MAG TPA: thiamine pyrophosphate-binding protein [Bryobacteraceae bacterium]|jgi:benzoylformate decarboxylase|nr:thiamine pyrophosphate-binding protein [Bryobacteraceae bacterium]